MKNILIPSDFSVESAVAFNYAVQIAHLTEAKLTLLHAYHVPVFGSVENSGSSLASLLDVTADIASTAFTEAIKKAHSPEILESLKFEYVHTPKFNVQSIIELHETHVFDLIIIENKPQNKLYDLLFGNYIDKLIDHIKNTPLMVVPPTVPFCPIQHIVYSTAMLAPFETLVSLCNFVRFFGAKVSFLHIIEEDTRSYPQKAAAFKDRAAQAFTTQTFDFIEIKNPDIEDTLLDFLHNHIPRPDLLLMIERPKRTFDRLFINSMTKNMTQYAPLPIVIFHEPSSV